MAARWAVKLGYENVSQFPWGYQGWVEAHSGRTGPAPDTLGLRPGNYFPACGLTVLDGKKDRPYLGLEANVKSFGLNEIGSPFLLVALYNELCSTCLSQFPVYDCLFQAISNDRELKPRIRFIGLGVESLKREVAKFRKMKGVAFPLFADERREVFNSVGRPSLPVLYLLKKESFGHRILMIHKGPVDAPDRFLSAVRDSLRKESSGH